MLTTELFRQTLRYVWKCVQICEHTIGDEDDFSNHFDYIHFYPVKHGLVRHVKEWPPPSFD